MICRVLEIDNPVAAQKELLAIGAEAAGVKLMAPKALLRVVKLSKMRPVAANIIKQEMLAVGGEAATAFGSINHSVSTTDVLIFGTIKQFHRLIDKLQLHQFGLPQLSAEIRQALDNYEGNPEPLKLAANPALSRKCWGHRTYIMGILNVTPDSFSDGGKFIKPAAALAQAKQLLSDGADIIDVGGESTRPGAEPVCAKEESERVLPVIEQLVKETGAIVSIDTTKAEVAAAALAAGAALVNDISGLRFDPKMAATVAKAGVPICLMHLKGQPQNMQDKPAYQDLMGEIIDYLAEGLEIAKRAGILHGKIIVDPGIGFGKTVEHNLEILKRLRELKVLGCPILVGTSRKSMIGQVLGRPADQRVLGTAATVAIAIANGADIIRVHDAFEMAQVAKMSDAILRRGRDGKEEG